MIADVTDVPVRADDAMIGRRVLEAVTPQCRASSATYRTAIAAGDPIAENTIRETESCQPASPWISDQRR
jgi:hypothetical protein